MSRAWQSQNNPQRALGQAKKAIIVSGMEVTVFSLIKAQVSNASAYPIVAQVHGAMKKKGQSPIIARAAIGKSCGRIVYDKILTVEPPTHKK